MIGSTLDYNSVLGGYDLVVTVIGAIMPLMCRK